MYQDAYDRLKQEAEALFEEKEEYKAALADTEKSWCELEDDTRDFIDEVRPLLPRITERYLEERAAFRRLYE
jgi:chromosome segregation ATPase